MRIRSLIIATLLAASAILLLPTAALAQEQPSKKLDKANEECVKLLESGKDVNDCQKAPSPIKPATNELVWGIISFTLLLGLLWKFAYPGLKKGMDGRTERIRADLAAADTTKAEADQVLEQYKAQLADARNESGRIIEEARQTADAMKRDAETRLQAELAEIKARSVADIEAAKAQALADLRGEVAELAIGAAEAVIQKNLDRETQVRLVEEYISTVGAVRS